MYNPRISGADLLESLRTPGSPGGRIDYLGATATPQPAVEESAGQVIWRSDQPAKRIVSAPVETSEAERAFDQLVALKMTTADVSMHLDAAWRSGLFKQLDNLLDAEEWDFSDEMPSVGSFKTFLRMIIHNRVKRRPGLGATSDGKIIATWTVGADRLTVECKSNDTVRWVATKYIAGDRVSSANTGPVSLLREFLAPFKPDLWFG
jgi:hypothetical protein